MKSYTLPLIVGAAVIALATLFYALFLPSPQLDLNTDLSNETSVIAEPATNTQASVTPKTDEALDDSAQDTPAQTGQLVIDIARVQADGMAVFAGKGAPNGTIYITEQGAIFAQNTIDEQGQWVVLPEMPLSPGAHLLELEMVTLEGLRERASVSLVVEISENADEKPLVAIVPQTDDSAPTILQLPEEAANDKAPSASTKTNDEAEPKSQAEQVAEILGQESIFIQIGSLSWNESGDLSVHGVASGGASITGQMANMPLEMTALSSSGRWTSVISGAPFATADRQLLEVSLLDDEGKELARTQLMISKSQLSSGLDGSVMVVVHKGDALWRIAYRSYGQGVRYVDIVRRNADQIDDPDLIYPNQIFAVPGVKSE